MKKTIRHKKANLLLIILALAATIFLTKIQYVHATDNRIFFQPAKPIGEVGTLFTVNIKINVTNFRNLKFSISWNPGSVNCTSIQKGTFLDPHQVFNPGVVNNTLGTIENVLCTWAQSTGKNGTGTIAIVSFKAIQVGGTPITFTKVEGTDSYSQPMTYTIENGYATLVKTLTHHLNWTDPNNGNFEFDIITKSNSTVGPVNFNQTSKSINFTVTGPNGSFGFCNVTIPRNILDSQDITQWQVYLEETNITDNCQITRDTSNTRIYIPYAHSTQTITVRGTWVIPEFPANLMLPLIVLASLAIIPLIRRKQKHS